MNELNFAIGFIVGALFATALMFIIKKIFFNFFPLPEINKTDETKKDNKPNKSSSIIPNPNNNSKEKNNLESENN
ncbi:hypothetical protein LFWB_7140 [Candidatus Phytoplasma luffae]|uniref:Uncharacterized protein n=1 Tax=Loofah witches'-broom phytoplasma TaxID=35773 RepID=A0A975FIT9_LOWBP|nr:hypothetical protein [Candidatus Phytoplasma luffae]QTX02599.1 hypothetical protein LFWB_0290 [Candidatus Phytoplasma luffae]QTX02627.1 hypothetical protein LFWB_0570 [Candidatus Phytoplasma luffae]QTX02728.1 hypothetical protein LFWB_1580 [Candidatus Phytoplasma luffae]QTX02865.1 hypothetical protein LFWB_2950 [Candidatus Phytoplasma luffae]QTX02910.1 hypothetical protein LFWB_3400 [Candidatus Phytoplasma luffae]